MLDESLLNQLRDVCLALPEAVEGQGVGSPSFRVRDKIFAMHHPMQNRPSLWCKARPGLQDSLVASEPERYFVPPYVGQHGWIGLWLDIDLDWNFITDLVEDSYCRTAPKRLVAQLRAQ